MDASLTTAARGVLFAHWAVDPGELRPHVPEPLELDTYDGDAWLGVLTFEVVEARPRALPPGLAPTRPFGQVNLRTYVRHDDRPGVYFLTLDAGTRIGAAALGTALGLPCYRARTSVSGADSDEVRFRSRRSSSGQPPATFEATYGPTGPASTVEHGSLDEFCIERTRWYTTCGRTSPYLSRVSGAERLRVGEIQRDPWQVADADADIERNSLARAVGLEAPGEPVVRFSPGFESTIQPR